MARIKDKEQALDAENKILRAQLTKNKAAKMTKPSKAEPRDRAMDYHSLPGEQSKQSPSKLADRYSKLSGDGASSVDSLDEEPVKMTASSQAQPTIEASETTNKQQQVEAAGSFEINDATVIDEIENLLSDERPMDLLR